MKIGRNDLCLCGSGMKYKRCCIGNNPLDPPLPGPRRFESEMLSDLLENSETFRTFYDIERKKLVRPLIWVEDNNLSETVKAAATLFPSGTQWIQMRWTPIPLEHFQVVMHEMMHLVLWSEGFPLVIGPMEMGELVAEINTTFQDPIVEMRLKAYGVDPWVDYEEVQNRSLPKLSGEISVGDTPIDEVFWGLFYAGSILDYNVATQDKIDAQPNLVRGSLDSISTDIKRYGEKILDWAASIGFDTPEKMERMLQHILSYYDLEPILYLRKFA